MMIKYNVEIADDVVRNELDRITNQIFKLLPNREEGGDWQSPLQNIIIELVGMSKLIDQSDFFLLLCKMEALTTLTEEEDFFVFRKTILECCRIVSELKCLI